MTLLDYRPPADLLRDRVILVTGAGDGLGRAAAVAAARHGATVILLGRTLKKLEKVYDEIMAAGAPEPLLMPLDLAEAGIAHCSQIGDSILAQFGRLDGLLHSAAYVGPLCPVELFDAGEWQKIVQVNLNAAFLLTRACLPAMRLAQDASLVFTTSDVARHGRAYWGAYAAAGAALENLAQTLASEHENDSPVRVHTFDPGAVRTRLRERAFPGEDPNALPTPESLVPAYLYLLGPAGHTAHGQALTRDS
jgi:NAD(P)-dependent dehydrogenase (short-subunit alcohol dehydrogenase family)